MKKIFVLIIAICLIMIILDTNELWQLITGGAALLCLLAGWACLKIASESDKDNQGKDVKSDGSKEILESAEEAGHAD